MTSPIDPLADSLREALGPAYEIESELSGGGMSRVFVATERALNRKVVVKVLPPDVAAGVNRERFRREIQLAAQLQHPHIVPLLAAGDTGGLLYYTMPFIEGESLKHALAHGARFSPREVIGILLDIVDALAYAHARGVIHRDVKPANVLRSGMHAVVADFGVAKALSASLPAVGMTTSGMAIGTPQYMAPEQLAGDPAADHRMDIYAVGLLGYELLTGAPTFAEQSPQATLAAQLTRNPEPLALRRPDVPDALSSLLMRCLAKDPGSRPATAQAVRTELEEIVMPSGDYPPPGRVVERRLPLGIPLLVAAGVVVVAVLAVMANRGDVAPALDSPTPATSSSSGGATPAPDSTALRPAAPVVTDPPAPPRPEPASDSSGGRQATPPAPRATSSTARRSGAPRSRTLLDSIAELALLFKAQSPPDPVVRPPSPNSVSQAAFDERRANMGPKRKVLLVADPDSVSRAVSSRVARLLDGDRYAVTVSDTEQGSSSQGGLDSLAAAGGHDLVLAFQAPLRRDSSHAAVVRLRDLTAHSSYATSGASRRILRDSVGVGADSLAALVVRRVTTMDRAPRLGAVDPEARAFQERARDMGPPRRVVIWNHPPHENLSVQESGTAVMDALRAAIRGHARFTQVPRDSTLDLLARSRNRETVLAALKSDFMVSISSSFNSSAMDSVSWVISVRDVGAAQQFQERSFRSASAPMTNPLAFVAATLARVIAGMEQIDAAPRRPATR
jgi:serine/threonine protein kinase